MSVHTDRASECRYAESPDVAFADMPHALWSEDGLYHTANEGGLADGNRYAFHVRCAAVGGQTNVDDFEIAFAIEPAAAATHIYRSVGPSQAGALVGSSGGNGPMHVGDGVASFAASLPDQVGVGDLIQYDADGNGEEEGLLSVVARQGGRELRVTRPDGEAVAAAAAPIALWHIFRAHVSLADAFTGKRNPGLEASLVDYDGHSGALDLVARKQVWHIACYADGVDKLPARVTGWTTSPDFYLHVFSPRATTEVGRSQRHQGRWTEDGYTIRYTDGNAAIDVEGMDYVRLEGLQVEIQGGSSGRHGVAVYGQGAPSRVDIDACIFKAVGPGGGLEQTGAEIYHSPADALLRVCNSVFYGFTGQATYQMALAAFSGTLHAHHNTLADSHLCLTAQEQSGGEPAKMLSRHNLFVGCTVSSSGKILPGTGHNASDGAAFDYEPSAGGAVEDWVDQSFVFVDRQEKDFHLDGADTGARDRAGDLTGEADGFCGTDIDGEPRHGVWDLGADEL